MPGAPPLLARACSLLAASLLLVGCGAADEPSADNHGYGWDYDLAAASGLRLRYDPAVGPEDRTDPAVFEAAYAEVQTCLGLAAAGPLVVVVPRGSLDDTSGITPPPGAHVGGLYFFDTDLVVVTESLHALRHEMVHFLLDQARFPVDRNRAHDHPGFTSCT